MNISTYEARIKALEDQLNPPGPGGSTGLLSVTVSPDITLGDGTSLNAKLASMMPIAADDSDNYLGQGVQFPTGAQYTVTATPGSDWFAFIGSAASSAPGESVSVTVEPEETSQEGGPTYKSLQIVVVVSDALEEEKSTSDAFLSIGVTSLPA